MAYELESTKEVQELLATFNECPEAYAEDCKAAYLTIAKNKAVQRLLQTDIEDIQAKYNVLVAGGKIDDAIELVNKLNALRTILDTATEHAAALAIPSDALDEWTQHAKEALGSKLNELRHAAGAAEPPHLLNHKVASDMPAFLNSTRQEQEVHQALTEWAHRYNGLFLELERWSDERPGMNLIAYIRRGVSMLDRYADLPAEGLRISKLVTSANQAYAKKTHLADIIEDAKGAHPWKSGRYYSTGSFVRIGAHIYMSVKGGTSGKTQPTGEGEDGTTSWRLVGPSSAIQSFPAGK